MGFLNINRKNYLVCFLNKIIHEMVAYKPLKLWEKVGNGKTVLSNNEICQATYLAPSNTYWAEIPKRTSMHYGQICEVH